MQGIDKQQRSGSANNMNKANRANSSSNLAKSNLFFEKNSRFI